MQCRDIGAAAPVRLIPLVRPRREGSHLGRAEDARTPLTHRTVDARDHARQIVEHQVRQMSIVNQDLRDALLVPRCGIDEHCVLTTSQPYRHCPSHTHVAARPKNDGTRRADDADHSNAPRLEQFSSSTSHGSLRLAEGIGDARPRCPRIGLQRSRDPAAQRVQLFSTLRHRYTLRKKSPRTLDLVRPDRPSCTPGPVEICRRRVPRGIGPSTIRWSYDNDRCTVEATTTVKLPASSRWGTSRSTTVPVPRIADRSQPRPEIHTPRVN